jgi:phosphatidyl-myo-inositol dimannoside synthase
VYYHYLLSGCDPGDVIVATRSNRSADAFDATTAYTVRRTRFIRHPQESRIVRMCWYFLLIPRLLAWIVRYRISVVHLGSWAEVIPVWLSARALGRAFMITIHGEELTRDDSANRDIAFRWMWRIHDLAARRALRHADAIQANSEFTKSVLLAHGVREDRIHVTTPGIDVRKTLREPVIDRSIAARLEGRRLLLTVGRLEARKGQDMVLRALPLLLPEYPDLYYVMAGESVPQMHDYYEGLVHDLGLEAYATVFSNLDNQAIAYLYDRCQVFVMANRELENGDTEGYGIVFLEAGAWGKPAIGGRAGGATEAVDDGVTGLLVDGTDPKDIATAIGALLADDSLAKRMGEAGRRKVLANGWDSKSREYRELIKRLAAR